MNRALLALVLLLLLPIPVRPQSAVCSDQGSTIIDTMQMEIGIPSQSGKVASLLWEVIVDRTSGGQVNYRIDPGTIRFQGDAAVINSLSTSQVFDLIATTTVSNGVAIGTTPCPTSCTTPSYATVVQPSCISRSGSGESTRFDACYSSGCCRRTYSVCCPNGPGSPQVVLVNSQGTTCLGMGGGCESTCP